MERTVSAAPDERMLRAVFENSMTPMLLIDDSRRYVAANQAAALLLQYSCEELLKKRVDDVTPEERLGGLDDRWSAFIDRGHATGRVPLLRGDGGRIEVDHSSTANVASGMHFTVLSPREVNGGPDPDRRRLLSTREREVLTALAGGQTGGDIARQLYIAPDTVRRHVANAREKL